MTQLLDINKHKNKRLLKKVVDDIDKILHIIDLAYRGLKLFHHYVPVKIMLMTIVENKRELERHRELYVKKLGEMDEL